MSSGSERSGSEGGFKIKKHKKDKSKDKDKKDKKDKDKSGDKDKKDKDKKDKKDKDKDKEKKHEGASGHSGASVSGHGSKGPEYGAPVGGGHAAEYFSATTVSTPAHSQAPVSGHGAPPPPPYASAPGFPGVDTKSPPFPGASPPFPGGNVSSFPQAGMDIKSPPFPGAPTPPAIGGNAPPPSGYRVPLRTDSAFPPPDQTGPPVAYEADGVTPLFIGSALFETSVQPCKIGPHLQPAASVPYGGGEHGHHGRYDLLPFVPQQMEWVHTGYGQIPAGRRPIEGGYEENGGKLYHALAPINGVNVPGKTGEHLGGANIAYGGQEHAVQQYQILCWK